MYVPLNLVVPQYDIFLTPCFLSQCILAGDQYYVLFVWSGRDTFDSRFDEVREHFKDFLLKRSVNRFPMPMLHILREGDSMSRRFTALLGPSHGDPVDHQLTNFPALASLTPSELAKVQSKSQVYDSTADPSFRTWFWNVASASGSTNNDGISLCD
jgi:hypothetical protein